MYANAIEYIHHLLFGVLEHSATVNIVSDVEGVITGRFVRVIPCLHSEHVGLASLYHQLRYQGVSDVVSNAPSYLTCASGWGNNKTSTPTDIFC